MSSRYTAAQLHKAVISGRFQPAESLKLVTSIIAPEAALASMVADFDAAGAWERELARSTGIAISRYWFAL